MFLKRNIGQRISRRFPSRTTPAYASGSQTPLSHWRLGEQTTEDLGYLAYLRNKHSTFISKTDKSVHNWY